MISTNGTTDPAEELVSQLRLDGELARVQPDLDELTGLIEALLLVSGTPPTFADLAEAADVDEEAIRAAIARLAERQSGGWIVQVHGEAVHLATAPRFSRQVRAFLGLEREGKLSSAAMETLAIIAYRQPVTRAEIDAVRGVDSSGVLATLHARELIEPVSRLAAVGNPFQYGTTPGFLRLFGLQSLSDLPELGSFGGTDGLALLAGAMENVEAPEPIEKDTPRDFMTKPVTLPNGFDVPQGLIDRWSNFHGAKTTADWIANLPALLDTWCSRHEITLDPVVPPISFNLVLFGSSAVHGPVVLKLSPPSPEVRSEIAGLREAAGHGMVRLIDADPGAAVMLLERVEPGTMLDQMDLSDEEMTRIGAESMLRFWREPADSTDLWPLRIWLRELLDYTPGSVAIPADLVSEAQTLATDLLDNPTSVSLLHGDMHHQNILRHGADDWVTIDPKGLIGERGYEVGTWMLNPWGLVARDDYVEVANRRLDLLAELLGEDRDRLARWTFIHSVISLIWTLSDDAPDSIDTQIADLRRIRLLLP